MSAIHKIFATGLTLVSVGLPTHATAAELMDNTANAIMLANQAKSLIQSTTKPLNPLDNNQKTRENRGSEISETLREAECGGVAIGNVRPSTGDGRSHNTTVIIRGNVINSNNKC